MTEARTYLAQKMILSQAATLIHDPIVDGLPVVPTSAVVTLLKPGGIAFDTPVASANATIATNGRLSYSLSAGQNDPVGVGYIAKWRFVYNSTSYHRQDLYDVVYQTPESIVSENDLFKEFPALRNANVGDYDWKDCVIHAWNRLESDLRNKGLWPFLVFKPTELYFAQIYKAIEGICFDQIQKPGDVWAYRAVSYGDKYQKEVDRLILHYDKDGDNVLEGDETQSQAARGRLIR